MADITATTGATYLPEIWSTKGSLVYAHTVVSANLLDRQWEPEVVREGDTVFVPVFTQSTSGTKRSTFGTGASVTFTATTESQIAIAINTMAYIAFRVPVELNPQIYAGYVDKLTSDIGVGVANQVETDIGADNTNGYDAFSTEVGTDNVDVTEDNLLTAETNLNDARAKQESRYLVVSPATRQSMFKIESVRSSLYATSMGNLNAKVGDHGAGYFGSFLTFDCYMSTLLEAGSSGKKNAAFQKEAIALIVQKKLGMARVTNIADGIFDEVAGWVVYGLKEIKDNHGNQINGK